MDFNKPTKVKVNEVEFRLKQSTPNVKKQIKDLDELYTELAEESDEIDLDFDAERRGQFYRQLAQTCLDPVEGEWPDDDFWQSDDLHVGTLINVRDFLETGSRRMMAMLIG